MFIVTKSYQAYGPVPYVIYNGWNAFTIIMGMIAEGRHWSVIDTRTNIRMRSAPELCNHSFEILQNYKFESDE